MANCNIQRNQPPCRHIHLPPIPAPSNLDTLYQLAPITPNPLSSHHICVDVRKTNISCEINKCTPHSYTMYPHSNKETNISRSATYNQTAYTHKKRLSKRGNVGNVGKVGLTKFSHSFPLRPFANIYRDTSNRCKCRV